MKTLFYLCAIAVFFVTACTTDKTHSFMPGTYVNSVDGEFSVADDTLVIKPAESNNYLIYRKTGFNIITNGKEGKRQYEAEQWNAVYDEGTKTLTETRKSKQLSFYPESNILKLGRREYRKIN